MNSCSKNLKYKYKAKSFLIFHFTIENCNKSWKKQYGFYLRFEPGVQRGVFTGSTHFYRITSISHNFYFSESFWNSDVAGFFYMKFVYILAGKFNGARTGTCCTTFTQPFNKKSSSIVVCYISLISHGFTIYYAQLKMAGFWWFADEFLNDGHCRKRYKTIKSFHICVRTLK